MLKKSLLYVTAILIMAVIVSGGCATKRDVEEIKAQIRNVETQTRQTQQAVGQMDSTISAGAEADIKLRNDIRYSVQTLQEQIDILLQNYNDLLTQLQRMDSRETIHVLGGSVGQGSDTVVKRGQETVAAEPLPAEPAIDCQATYDEAFLDTRRGDYTKAIAGWQAFIDNCSGHSDFENAYYWMGESYYAEGKYIDAIQTFDTLLKNFKSTVNASRAMYKMARSQQELGRTEDAKRLFQKVVDEYPETLEASQAKEILKTLK